MRDKDRFVRSGADILDRLFNSMDKRSSVVAPGTRPEMGFLDTRNGERVLSLRFWDPDVGLVNFGGNVTVERELLLRNCSNGLDFVAWASVDDIEAVLGEVNNGVEKVALLLSGNGGRSLDFVDKVAVVAIGLAGSVSSGVVCVVFLDRGLSFVECFDTGPSVVST